MKLSDSILNNSIEFWGGREHHTRVPPERVSMNFNMITYSTSSFVNSFPIDDCGKKTTSAPRDLSSHGSLGYLAF